MDMIMLLDCQGTSFLHTRESKVFLKQSSMFGEAKTFELFSPFLLSIIKRVQRMIYKSIYEYRVKGIFLNWESFDF
jgi:hypothetical protein